VSAQFGADSTTNTNALYKAGLPKQAGEYAKAAGDLAKDKSAAEKTQAETLDKSLGTFRSYVAQVTTPEAAGQYTAAMYDHPLLGKFAANFGSREDAIKRNMDAFSKDPRAWTTGAAGMTADKLLETMKGTRQNTNVGGNSRGETIDYYGGVVPGQTTNTPITQSADNKATVAQQEINSVRTDDRVSDATFTKVEENKLKREAKDEVAKMTKDGQLASFDTMLGTLGRLAEHKGLSRSVGMTGMFPTMPGSDSANFQAELNTFQSQAFIPMVAQLKGMGALSDAEGKKLTAAVGALDPKMGEPDFRASVKRITDDMEAARKRVAGTPKTAGTEGAPGKPDMAGMEAEMRKRGLIK